jgi:hypothetical protein
MAKNCNPHYKGKPYETFADALKAIRSSGNLEATASEYYNLHRKALGETSIEEGSAEDMQKFEEFVAKEILGDNRFNQPDFDREADKKKDSLSDDEVEDLFGFDDSLNFEDKFDRERADDSMDFGITKKKKKLIKEGMGAFLVIDRVTGDVYNSYKQSKTVDSIFEVTTTALESGQAKTLKEALAIAKKQFIMRRTAYNQATDQETFDAYSDKRKKAMAIEDTSDADEFFQEYDMVIRNWSQFERFTQQKMKALFGIVNNKKPLSSTKASKEMTSEEQLEGFEQLESVLEKVSFDDGASFQINHKDTATARLKAFLAVQRDAERSFLNLPTFIPFDTVYDEIQMALGGKSYNNLEEMKKDLLIAAASKPYLENLITGLEKKSKQTQKDFFVAFSKQHQQHVFTDFVKQTSEAFGDMFVQYRNMDSNRNDVVKTIRKKWLENQKKSPMVQTVKGELMINPEVAKQFDAEVERLAEEKDVSLEDTKALLALTGVEISDDALQHFMQKSKKLTGTSFKGHFRKGGAFYYLAKSFTGESKTAEVDEALPLSVNNPLISGENTSMDTLAKLEAEFTDSVFSKSFRNVESKTIYSYGLHSHFSHMMSRLLENNGVNAHTNMLSKMSFSKRSEWLRRLMEEDSEFRDNFGFYYLDGIKKQKSTQKGRKRGQQSKREMEIQMLSLFQNKNNDKAFFIYPTISDKTTTPVISALRHKSVISIKEDGSIAIGKNPDTGVNTAQALMDIFLSEKYRIENYTEPEAGERYGSKKDGYDAVKYDEAKGKWTGGAINFYMFPSLNKLVDEGVISINRDEKTKKFTVSYDKKAVINAIKEEVKQRAIEKVERWRSLGIIKDATPRTEGQEAQPAESFLDRTYMKSKLGAGFVQTSLQNQALLAALDMEINYAIANASVRQLITGDPATHYKKSVKATLDEYTKRIAKDIAPGMDGAFESDSYNMIFLEDLAIDSQHLESYDKRLAKQGIYTGLDATDAQEYTTVQEHLDVMYSYGKLSETEYNDMSNKVKNKENFSDEQLRVILQPMKPVQVYNKPDMARDVNMPIYVKSSSFPLIPQLTKGLEIDKLRVQMEGESGNDIQRAAYKSAAKLGAKRLANIWNKDGTIKDDINLSEHTVSLSRSGFRVQQEVPYKEDKVKITTVSQMNKLLFEGILHIEGMPELRQKKESIRKKLFDIGFEKFQKKTGIKVDREKGEYVVEDIAKLKKSLQDEAISRGYPINDIMALELAPDKKSFVIPISMNTSSGKIESILMSMITNNLVKHKMPGKSYVQGSSAGFLTGATKGRSWNELSANEVNDIVFMEGFDPANGLKFVREENGEVKPAQVLLPFYFRNSKGERLDITKYTKTDANGKTVIDTEMIPEELLRLIGARIPNQGHSSMLPIEVAGFLPESMGDLIIVPHEITKQMGADFDVDKLYTYQYLYYVDKDTNKLVKKGKRKVKPESQKKFEVVTDSLSLSDFIPNIAKSKEQERVYEVTKNGFEYQLRKYGNGMAKMFVSHPNYKKGFPIATIDLIDNGDGTFSHDSDWMTEEGGLSLISTNFKSWENGDRVLEAVKEAFRVIGVKEMTFKVDEKLLGDKFVQFISDMLAKKDGKKDFDEDVERVKSKTISTKERFEAIRKVFKSLENTDLASFGITKNNDISIKLNLKTETKKTTTTKTPSEITSQEANDISEKLVMLAGKHRITGEALSEQEKADFERYIEILENATIVTPQDVDVVREPVKMGNITFNQQQTAAYYSVLDWHFNSNSTAYMIEGYAGTGKTTIVKRIIEELEANGEKILIAAPTNAAVSVLEESTDKPGYTIHQLLDLKPDEKLVDFDPESPQFKQSTSLLGPKLLANNRGATIIIDEASMINAKVYDYLLQEADLADLRIIFMGDPAQIPPVGEKESKAFSETINKSLLTKVERQAGDNPLGTIYDSIRNNINSPIDMFTHKSKLNDKREGIEFFSTTEEGAKKEFQRRLVEAFKEDPKGTKLITYRNDNVRAYNEYIRKNLFPDAKEPFVKGDIMIMRKGAADISENELGFMNSEEVEVSEVSEIKERDGIKYVTLSFETKTKKGIVTRKLNVLYPTDENQRAYQSEISRLAREAKAQRGAKGAWDEYYALTKSIIGSMPGKNWAIDYGYAITAHKSQGSTYNQVFINEINIDKLNRVKERNQIKYVALSRPRKNAIVLTNKSESTPVPEPIAQPQELKPEEVPAPQTKNEYQIPEQVQSIIDSKDKYFNEFEAVEGEEEGAEAEVEEQDTESSLKNDYIDIHWKVLTNTEVLPRILAPLDKEGDFSIADDSGVVDEIRTSGKEADSQLFTSYNVDTFIQNKGGKDGVGVFSLASTFNAYIQGYDLFLGTVSFEGGKKIINEFSIDNFVTEDGKDVKLQDLSHPGKNPNGDKSSNISDMQSAAVDNAKNQTLDKINLNMTTFPAAIALNQLSDKKGNNLHIQYTTRFFPQRIIMDFVEEMSNLSDSTTDEFYGNPFETAMVNVINRYAANIKNPKAAETALNNLTEAGMTGSNKIKMDPEFLLNQIKAENNPNDQWYIDQIEMLKVFKQLTDVGKEIQKISKALNTDSKGVAPSTFDVQDKIERIEKLSKDRSPLIRGARDLVTYGELATYSIANNISQSAYKTLLMQNSDLTVKSIDMIAESIGRTHNNEAALKPEDKNKIFDALKSFMFAKQGLVTANINESRQRLLLDTEENDSLATRVKEAKESWGADNHLLVRLMPVFPTKKGDPALVEYNASLAERFDEVENVKAFIDMLGSPDPAQVKLAEDLVEYLFITSGIQGARNFMKFVPITYLNSSNISKRIRDLSWEGGSLDSNFKNQFMQHNPQMAPAVPKALLTVKENQTSFTLSSPDPTKPSHKGLTVEFDMGEGVKVDVWVDFFMVRDKKTNKFRLFMKENTFSNKFIEVDTAGGEAGFTEYSPADFLTNTMFDSNKSKKTKAQERKTREEAKKDIPVPLTVVHGGTVTTKSTVNNITDGYGLKDSDTKESVMEAVKKIANESTDPFNQALAKVLMANGEFVENFNFFLDSTIPGVGKYKYASENKPGELRIKPEGFTDEDGNFDSVAFEKILLHELIHQQTGTMIHDHWKAVDAGKPSPLDPKLQKAVKSLDAVRKAILSNLDPQEKAEFEKFDKLSAEEKLESDLSVEKKYMYYALGSPTEFITQVLTSENFQKQLSGMEFNSKQSFLDRILQLFQELFDGLKTSIGVKVDGTALQQAVAESVNLLETINTRPATDTESDTQSDDSLFFEKRPSIAVTDGTQLEIRDFFHNMDRFSGMKNSKGKVKFYKLGDQGFKAAMIKAQKANENPEFQKEYGDKYVIKINKTPLGYMLDVHQYQDTMEDSREDYALDFDAFEVLDPNIEKTISVLQDRIKTLERKMSNSKTKKIEYQNRIDALNNQIEKLKDENSIATVKLVADAQLDWAEKMLKKPKLSNSELREAANVIDAWSIIQDMYGSGYNETFQKAIDSIANRAKRLDGVRKEALLSWAQKNVKMPDGKSIAMEDLQVMKDTGLMRATFLDLSRVDNPAVQALAEWLHDAARDTNYEFTQLENQIAEAMTKLKTSPEYKANGYDVFLQTDAEGNWTGGMTNRYSQAFYDERARVIKKRKAKGDRGWKEYFDWKKKNEILVDSNVLFNTETGERLTDSTAKKHIKELEEEFGKERAAEVIQQAEDKYLEYLQDLKMAEEGFRANATDSTTEEQIQAMVHTWKVEHSPNTYINSYNGKAIIKGTKLRGYKYTITKPRKYKDDARTKLTGWYDEKYEKIENDAQLKEFYDFYRNIMTELRSNLPTTEDEKLQENFIPFIQKSILETFTTNGAKAGVGGLYANFVESLSEPDNVMVSADRDVKTGALNKRVPIRFLQKGDPENQSKDIIKALELFALMSLNYKHKTNVEDKALLMQRLINEAAEQKTTSSGESKRDALGNMFRIYGTGAMANTNTAVEHAINAALYGERRAKGASTGILVAKEGLKQSKKATDLNRKIKQLRKKYNMGQITEEEYEAQAGPLETELEAMGARNITSVDVADFITSVDVADFMMRVTQLKGMAFNIFSAGVNMSYGVMSNFIHAAGQEDFTTKQAMTAWRIMLAATGKSLGVDRMGIGSDTSKKINALMKGNTKSREVAKSTSSKLMKLSPYELQKRAEYFIQGMTMVAKMLNTEVQGKNGPMNLFDAFDVNGEINEEKFGKDLMREWSGDITDKSQMVKFKKFRNATIQLNKRLHGNYDPNSLPLAKKYILGRVALQFRSWLAEGIALRFEAGTYDKQLDREVKGMYRSIYDVARSEGLFAPIKYFIRVGLRNKDGLQSLSATDRANFKKVLSELTWKLSLTLLGLLITHMAGDDDDEDAKTRNILINQINRVYGDLTFYTNVKSFEAVLSNPIPLMRTINDAQKAMGATIQYFTQDDDIDGRSEMTGEKLIMKYMKALPYFNQVPKWKAQMSKIMFD